MAYEMKEGTFSLFKNESDNEKAPRMKGKLLLNGKMYQVAVWTRESEKAGKWFSGSVEEITDRQPAQPSRPAPSVDEDVPW